MEAREADGKSWGEHGSRRPSIARDCAGGLALLVTAQHLPAIPLCMCIFAELGWVGRYECVNGCNKKSHVAEMYMSECARGPVYIM
jgi:hypothetical protein